MKAKLVEKSQQLGFDDDINMIRSKKNIQYSDFIHMSAQKSLEPDISKMIYYLDIFIISKENIRHNMDDSESSDNSDD